MRHTKPFFSLFSLTRLPHAAVTTLWTLLIHRSPPAQPCLPADPHPQRRPRAPGESRSGRTRGQTHARDLGPGKSQQVHLRTTRLYGETI